MNGRNAPLSPVSLGGSEWSGISKYQSPDPDGPYSNGNHLRNNSRGGPTLPISPPSSGRAGSVSAGSNNDAMMMTAGFPPVAGPRGAGGPSPPPSVGRSSSGTNMYARSESGRSQRDEQTEQVLFEHYTTLKAFLVSTSRDGKPNPPNRARDKLLRLSAVQFLELSTDVYDELMRRQARGAQSGGGGRPTPSYLLPEDSFHPKRNQARQKLSTLPPPRFKDLATDVFCELERRFPRFPDGDVVPRTGSAMSMRGRQTPVGGPNGYPPRSASRIRRPSESSSIRGSGPNGYPPSPGLPPGEFSRPQQKQFQSNTIIPNKSTMVEEDDDDDLARDNTSPGGMMDRMASNREKKLSQDTDRSGAPSETDKKLIEDYQLQVRELREKLDSMEDAMKKKDDEFNGMLDGERARATAANLEKKEWADLRINLENKVAEAQSLNNSLKQEIDRLRDEREDQAMEIRQLRDEVDQARAAANAARGAGGPGNPELQRENEELRRALEEQQQVTDQVRREAQEFLREMRAISQQSGSSWERQADMEKTIHGLEQEVLSWRNRYARAKTQIRSMRGGSVGLPLEQDAAAKYLRDRGFSAPDGGIKDVHVTKFQIAVDDLLMRARGEDPARVVDAMKVVVSAVRRITKDLDESPSTPMGSNTSESAQQMAKAKGRVSSTANNIITASKNFASAAGLSPVSILDAAASHLVAAVVELLRLAKIRPTPAGELDAEDEDEGTITPVESAAFFSPRSTGPSDIAPPPPAPLAAQPAYAQPSFAQASFAQAQPSPLEPPPPFQGLRGARESGDSSAYSPISSPRESSYSMRPPNGGAAEPAPPAANGYSTGGGLMATAASFLGINKSLPPNPNASPNGKNNNGGGGPASPAQLDDLKVYLDDQKAALISNIQELVGSIRGEAQLDEVSRNIGRVAGVVGQIVSRCEATVGRGPAAESLLGRLPDCRERLMEAGDRGRQLAARDGGLVAGEREWRMWTQTLPPIAFEIAREAKELLERVDRMVGSTADDFS